MQTVFLGQHNIKDAKIKQLLMVSLDSLFAIGAQSNPIPFLSEVVLHHKPRLGSSSTRRMRALISWVR